MSGTSQGVRAVVIGGGIVGLATARSIQAQIPGAQVTVLEKESSVATHQSGRNSGVVHSGLYYAPGSNKAVMVAEGRERLLSFCRLHAIPVDLCGKVVVATTDDELPRLRALEERGRANGLRVERLGPSGLADHEPAADGLAALFVPEAGITDYVAVCGAIAGEIAENGGSVMTSAEAVGISRRDARGTVITLADGDTVAGDWLVNCGGLHSDRITALAGDVPTASIMPFRGEYYELVPASRHLVRALIYPVPDPRFPFLGVHFTRMIDGAVHAGPNAVLAFAREGYLRSTVDIDDLREMATNPGAWRLASHHWRTGAGEVWRSLSKAAFVHALARLVPAVRSGDLVPSTAGVRAQALRRDGELLDDFAFVDGDHSIHVVNAPSPAATASLAIGTAIARRLADRLDAGT